MKSVLKLWREVTVMQKAARGRKENGPLTKSESDEAISTAAPSSSSSSEGRASPAKSDSPASTVLDFEVENGLYADIAADADSIVDKESEVKVDVNTDSEIVIGDLNKNEVNERR